MSTKIIGKMSVKTLGCNPRKVTSFDDGAAPLDLCTIMGFANGFKHGEDPKSATIWTCLTGEFEGVNLQTGESYRSGKLFLPAGIQDVVEAPLKQAAADKKEVVIRFAFSISAVKASNPIGYSYEARPLLTPQEDDSLAQLRKQIYGAQNAPAQLPAPAPVAAPVEVGSPANLPLKGKGRK